MGRHGAAPGRRRRGGARATARNKALALTTDCTPRYCQADPATRRRAGGGRELAQPHRRRRHAARHHRQHEFRQSRAARDHGPVRRLHRGHAARPASRSTIPVVSGNVSLYNETNGKGILPTPAIGGVGLIDDVGASRRASPSSAPGEAIILIGETKGHLGQSLYLREIAGPRGRRAAAGRSRRRAAQRRFRARARSRPAASPPATICPTAGCWWRWPRWRWRAASAPTIAAPPGLPAHAFLLRRGPGPLPRWPPPRPRRVAGRRPQRPAFRPCASARPAGDALTVAGAGAISVAELRRINEAGCPPTWTAEPAARRRSMAMDAGDDRAADQGGPARRAASRSRICAATATITPPRRLRRLQGQEPRAAAPDGLPGAAAAAWATSFTPWRCRPRAPAGLSRYRERNRMTCHQRHRHRPHQAGHRREPRRALHEGHAGLSAMRLLRRRGADPDAARREVQRHRRAGRSRACARASRNSRAGRPSRSSM